MNDALEHIEAALREVEKARSAVSRGRGVQVRSSDERDRLKAVSFAWFKSHRPHVGEMDTSHVDAAYHQIMEATARLAARATYRTRLSDAKAALVVLRGQAAVATPSRAAAPVAHDAPPAFAGLAGDPTMQAILERRWTEVQHCLAANVNLAATVMMGGLLESMLLARINATAKMGPIFTAKAAPRDKAGKTLPLGDWKLIAMVEVAHELAWISKSAKDVGNVLREYRNYIHPHKEHAEGIQISNEDARLFWEVCKAICRQVLASVGKTP
jgi:hypothetical protein